MKFLLVVSSCFLIHGAMAQAPFPESWTGRWSGKLEIMTSSGKVNEIAMELHVLPIDSTTRYSWTIFYGGDRVKGKRDYELLTIDEAKGHYSVDEKNSIKIEAYYIGGKLIQWFKVGDSLIMVIVEKRDNEMVWELVAGGSEAISVTGGEAVVGEEIPEVSSYSITNVQRAVLSKQ